MRAVVAAFGAAACTPLAILIWLLLRRTGFGRLLYAIGDNEGATRLAGVRYWQVIIVLYILSALLAGIGGFMARRIGKLETGRLLFEDWFREIRRHRGIADNEERRPHLGCDRAAEWDAEPRRRLQRGGRIDGPALGDGVGERIEQLQRVDPPHVAIRRQQRDAGVVAGGQRVALGTARSRW